MRIRGRFLATGFLVAVTAVAQEPPEESDTPSLELLEFLGEWGDEEQQWLEEALSDGGEEEQGRDEN